MRHLIAVYSVYGLPWVL